MIVIPGNLLMDNRLGMEMSYDHMAGRHLGLRLQNRQHNLSVIMQLYIGGALVVSLHDTSSLKQRD